MNQKQIKSLIQAGEYAEAACLLLQACEPGPKASDPESVYKRLLPWAGKRQECFLVVTLDGAGQIIQVHEITKGIANKTMVHPREVFRVALLDAACSVIIAHNHPSGSTEPSNEDLQITTRLNEAGKVMGIDVLDHIIISRKSYCSLRERGHLN